MTASPVAFFPAAAAVMAGDLAGGPVSGLYAELCAWTLARAYARSGHRIDHTRFPAAVATGELAGTAGGSA